MARAIQTGKLTPADELRDILGRLERRLANVGSATAEEAMEIFTWLDQVRALMIQLEQEGVDLRPERTRLEGIEGTLRNKAGIIVRKVGLRLPKKREELQPEEDRWWWWLDRYVLERTRRRLIRAGMAVGAIALIGIAIYVLMTYIFPPDPNVEKAQSFQMAAERYLMEGNWEEAARNYEEALTYTPNDMSLWIWLGVVREHLGDQAGAEEAFRRARELAPSELEYRVLRSQIYTQAGDGEKGLAEADIAVSLDPNSANAHFARAGALERLGRHVEAIAEFELTSQLAEETDPQLVVLARMRMGMLLQTMGVSPLAAETPTPTGQ
ncbi:MAG: hypothetical protein Kow0047_08040 [Anaerolineae bacterium]